MLKPRRASQSDLLIDKESADVRSESVSAGIPNVSPILSARSADAEDDKRSVEGTDLYGRSALISRSRIKRCKDYECVI